MTLSRSFAGRDDDGDFAAFCCWDGSDGKPWLEEVENYIRGALLRQPDMYMLAFREEGQLVAVSAFYKRTIGLPALDPIDHDAWHLEVMAVRLDRQGQGLSREVLDQTLAVMLEADPERVLIVGVAHRDNTPAFAAGAQIGLIKFVQQDEHYWVLVGELPDDPARLFQAEIATTRVGEVDPRVVARSRRQVRVEQRASRLRSESIRQFLNAAEQTSALERVSPFVRKRHLPAQRLQDIGDLLDDCTWPKPGARCRSFEPKKCLHERSQAEV